MSDRIFDDYNEFSFNSLYNFVLSFCNNKNEWLYNRANKIKEKIDTYYSIAKNQDDDECFIRIGWFGEELRDLLYMIITTYSCTHNDENHFATFLQKKLEQDYDPNYLTKHKIKHFSDNAIFLSKENEKLYTKGYNILKCINQNLSNLSIGITDFPCRYWTIVRELKTKYTEYHISEIPEGWNIKKILFLKKEKTKETTVFKLNNKTLEYSSTEPVIETLREDEISTIWR